MPIDTESEPFKSEKDISLGSFWILNSQIRIISILNHRNFFLQHRETDTYRIKEEPKIETSVSQSLTFKSHVIMLINKEYVPLKSEKD